MTVFDQTGERVASAHRALEDIVVSTRAELQVVELVEFRAAGLHALLTSYGHRFVDRATDDLKQAVEALKSASEQRDLAIAASATPLGVSFEATLRELCLAAPEPYAEELAGLRMALLAACRRVAELEAANVEILGAHMALVHEALETYRGEVAPVYGRETPSSPRVLRGVW